MKYLFVTEKYLPATGHVNKLFYDSRDDLLNFHTNPYIYHRAHTVSLGHLWFTCGFKTVHVFKNFTLIEKWSTLECFLLSKEVPILCCFVNVRIVNKTDCKFKFLI